jgi:hypothetical protein
MDFSGKHNFKTILQPKGILIEVDCVFDTKQIMDVYRGPGWTQSLVSLNRKKLEVIGAVFVLLDEDAIKKLEAICGSVKIVSAL